MGAWMVGVDTGGTFTDLIAVNQETQAIHVAKVASVPADPSVAVLNALRELFKQGVQVGDIGFFVHGTTVATNALLESKGVVTGLLITRGFRAVYEARGWSQPTGSDLIDTYYRKPPLLAPQHLTEEVVERLDYKGEVVTALDEVELRASVRRLRDQGVQAIAVCFLFSFLNPAHEQRAAAIIAEEAPDVRISLSSNVLPVIREYPRLSTTVIDAYVGPKIENYLVRLGARLSEAGIDTPQRFLMQSNGGLMRISIGARHPNQTLLSGPAAGVIAAIELAARAGERHVVTFDMGGTSTDISVIVAGQILETTEGNIAGQDIGTPMLKVRTLGAGGGTIAWIGKEGLLKVGPLSSGANPGPACYGRGGDQPTVTDANVVLGALSSSGRLAGALQLDEKEAKRAIQEKIAAPLGLGLVQAASGILRIVNTQMTIDLRLALQEQGQDPRRFALLAFGGAGPLHAAYIARALKIPRVLVPLHPGLNCAMGLLQTAVRHSYMQSAVGLLRRFPLDRINAVFDELTEKAYAEANDEGFDRNAVKLIKRIDLRYLQQGYTLGVTCPQSDLQESDRASLKEAFDTLHAQVYGQSAIDEDAEIVTLRVNSEIAVPQLKVGATPVLVGNVARAAKERRQVFDVDAGRFVEAGVFQREKLTAGDVIEGPAIVDQFDSTTLVLAGQRATVDQVGTLIIDEVQPS
jgi:N-methylhydantoinase A